MFQVWKVESFVETFTPDIFEEQLRMSNTNFIFYTDQAQITVYLQYMMLLTISCTNQKQVISRMELRMKLKTYSSILTPLTWAYNI
jgi:hypothetical protein